jgi:DNA repair protein RadD
VRKLRACQYEAKERIREAQDDYDRICLQLGTGAGKTDIMGSIVAEVKDNGHRVLILVHRRKLVKQIAERLEKYYGVKCGIIARGYPSDDQAQIQVASIDTYIRRLGQYPQFDLVFIDECHHSPAQKYITALKGYSGKVIGLTATPCRADGKGLDYFEVLIVVRQTQDLIDEGVLVKPLLFAPEFLVDRSLLKVSDGEFSSKSIDAQFEPQKKKIYGNVIDHYKRICYGSAAISFHHSVKAAQEFAEACSKAGVPAASVDGTMSDWQIENALDQLASGSIWIVANCQLLGEGVDVPRVECVIDVQPSNSFAWWLQKIGRGLRSDDERGKQFCYYLDCVGNIETHGSPVQRVDWKLSGVFKRKFQYLMITSSCPKLCLAR